MKDERRISEMIYISLVTRVQTNFTAAAQLQQGTQMVCAAPAPALNAIHVPGSRRAPNVLWSVKFTAPHIGNILIFLAWALSMASSI